MADPAHYQKLAKFYRACFCGDDGKPHVSGREVLKNLKAQTGYTRSPFTSDPYRHAYNAGMQDVMRHLLMMLHITDAELFALAAPEQQPADQEGFFGNDDLN